MSEGLEGLGRIMKVTALDDPEGPLSPRTENDPTKSDEFDQDELARKSPGYLRAVVNKAVADATASYEAKLAEKDAELNRRKAAENMLVRRTGELQDQLNRAPGANPAPAIRRNPMKWQPITIALLCVVTGTLVYRNDSLDKKVDGLTSYYLAKELSPEAMNSKTYLEVTPQMENIGADRFIAIARQLPYTDAATLDRLFNEESRWVVAEMWGEGANTVVRLNNWEDDGPFGVFGRTWVGNSRLQRSVLIHPHPTSLGVYKDVMEETWNRLTASDFNEREHYDVASEGALRVASYVANQPPITHEELVKLGEMNLMWDYSNGALFLVAPFGAGERFIRLADDDYRSLRNRMYFNSNSAEKLSCEASSWWYDMKRSVIKEEQTAAKMGE